MILAAALRDVMGIIDKRTTMFEGSEPTPENVIVASSTTIVDEHAEGVKDIPLNVQGGATTLVVAVTGPENEPASRLPRGVSEVRLVDGDGREAVAVAPDNEYGRFLFIVENPTPGRWRLLVRHVRESAFVVRAAAMRADAIAYVRRQWPTMRCTACKESLQASVAVAVGLIAGHVAVAAGVVVGIVVQRTHLPEHVIKYIIERCSDTTLDKVVEGACTRMEMCVAG